MTNPTGWKPTMEKSAVGSGLDGGTGAGGATRGLVHEEALLFERGSTGRSGVSLPPLSKGHAPDDLPQELRRDGVEGLPEISELEVIRHFTRISIWNHGIDTGLYPLGSCTMKYNPKSSEAIARLPGFANLHPLAPPEACQGALLCVATELYSEELIELFARTVRG